MRRFYRHKVRTLFLYLSIISFAGVYNAAAQSACDLNIETGDSIQDGIEQAQTGDVVCIASGTYAEGLIIETDSLKLTAEDSEDRPVLDGSGLPGGTAGVSVQSATGVEIENIVIRDFRDSGISAFDSPQTTVSQSDVSDNDENGILVASESFESEITGNTIRGNGEPTPSEEFAGIRIVSSEEVTVSGNTIEENWENGLELQGSGSATLLDNNVTGNDGYGFRLTGNSASAVEGNTFSGQSRADIYLSGKNNSVIESNEMELGLLLRVLEDSEPSDHTYTMNGNTVQGSELFYAEGVSGPAIPSDPGQVILNNVTGANVSDISFDGVAVPVQVLFGSNITVENITAENAPDVLVDQGVINVWNSSNSTIMNNTLSGNDGWGGIVVVNGNGATVQANTLDDNVFAGIRLFSLSDSEILENNISASRRGVLLEATTDVTVNDNDIERNSVAGVMLGQSGIVTSANETTVISSNRFDENDGPAIESNRSTGAVVELNTIQNSAVSGIVMTGDQSTAENSDQAIVKNNTVTGSERTGITVSRSDGVEVYGNTSSENSRAGINGQSVTNFSVSDNIVDQNGEEGITLRFVETVTVSGNEGDGNQNGFSARDISEGVITGNIFSNSTESGILFGGTIGNESTSAEIRDNTLNGNSEYGLVLQNLAANTSATGNTANGNTLGGILDNGESSVIENNITDNNSGGGIVLNQSTDGSITQNDAEGNETGILIESASGAVISENSVDSSSVAGIRIRRDAASPAIDNNTFTGNTLAARFDSVEAVSFTNNSTQAGVLMLGDQPGQFEHSLAGNTVQGKDLFYSFGETNPAVPESAGQVILASSSGATVSGLSFNGVAAPLQLAFSDNASFSDNVVSGASVYGISVIESDDVSLSGNSVSFQESEPPLSGTGVRVDGGSGVQMNAETIENAVENGLRVQGTGELSLDDVQLVNSGQQGVYLSETVNSSLSNLTILQSGQNGLFAEASDSITVENSEVSNSGENGMYLVQSPAATVLENSVSGSQRDGLRAEDSGELSLADNSFMDSGGAGVAAVSLNIPNLQEDILVSENVVANNGDTGLYISGYSGGTISGNQLNENENHGLNLFFSNGIRIEQNSAQQNISDGYYLEENAREDSLWFDHNNALDNGEAGIRLELNYLGNTGTEITDNEVDGNKKGLVMDITGGFSSDQVFENIQVLNNRFENHSEEAVHILKEPAGPDELVFTGNTIQQNGFGVRFDVDAGFNGPDEVPDARQNWWGSPDGPSGGVEDPETGAMASGNGDEVSEYVRFDPFLESVQVEGVYFAVSDVSTNSPVDAGDELRVQAQIENQGTEQGTQSITLTDENDNTLSSEEITLDPAAGQNVTLTWVPEAEDSGELELVIASSDEQVPVNVQILDAGEFVDVSECTTLDQPGNYRLTADLESSSSCIEIIAPDVRFDGDGYSINLGETASGQHFGIEIPTGEVRENIIVENVTLEGWFTGLLAGETTQSTFRQITVRNSSNGLTLYDADNNTVSDVTATDNSRGIFIGGSFGETGSSDNVVKSINASGNSIAGLFVASGEGNQFQQMELSGNQQGVQVSSDDANSYEDIEARNNSRNGINLVAGSGNEFTRVEAIANGWYGFNIEEVSGNRFTNIEARDNSWTGIHLAGSFSNPVTGNEFEGVLARDNAENGMFLSYASENHFEELLIESNGWNAVEISSQSEDNSLMNGEMNGNERNGISVASESHSNRFEELTFTANGTGENYGAVSITTESKYNDLQNLQVSGGANGLVIATDSTSADSVSVTQTTGTGIALTEGATGNEITNSEISGNGTDLEFSGGAAYNTVERLDFNGTVVTLDGFDVAVNAVTTPPEEPENGQPLGFYLDISELTEQGNLDYLNIFYEDSDTGNLNEESLSIWRYSDSGEWSNPESAGYTSGVDTDEKFVFAESVSDFSVFGVISGDMDTSLNPDEQPVVFELNQNYPNPFNPSTRIEYALPEPANVQLEVFNLIGERVAILVNEEQPSGWHEVRFDAGSLASGMYIYKIKAGNYTEIRKMTLIK